MSLVTKGFYTPFDALELFDKVLLHELTHTLGAGSLKDVSTDVSPFKFILTSELLILRR